MNARLAKEYLKLLPSTLFGGGLIIASAFTNDGAQLLMLTLAYWVACCLVSAAPFAGPRFDELSLQLAHPISRETIWREKLQTTVRALACIALLFALLTGLCLSHGANNTWFPLALGSLIAAPVFSLPVGFWIMLKIGDERAAVLLDLLAAMVFVALANATALLLVGIPYWPDLPSATGIVLLIFAVLVSPFFFHRARSTLNDWEDHQPLRQEFTISFQTGVHRRTGGWASRLTLMMKELHLQQTNGIFIAGLLLCGWAVRLEKEPELAIVAMITLVALFGPVMLGLGAVCEEHRLGMHSQQNTQPSGIWRQWFIKFFVCFACATTLGWPLVIFARELMPATSGSAIDLMPLGTINEVAGYPFADGPFWRYAIASAYGVALGMASGAAFRSYRHSIPALLIFYVLAGSSVDIGAKIIAELTWMNPRMYPHFVLLFMTGTLGLSLLLIGRTFYCLSALTPRGIRRQALVFLTMILLGWTTAHAIYLRTWEHLTLFQLKGPPLIDANQVAGFLPRLMTGSAVDHQGRLWTTDYQWIANRMPEHLHFHLEDARPIWKQAVGHHHFFLALQTNGTLWVRGSSHWDSVRKSNREQGVALPAYPHTLTQFGTDNDWAAITGHGKIFHALKRDGTFWTWGLIIRQGFKTSRSEFWEHPRQIGTEDDWVQIITSSHMSKGYALKEDATLWRWNRWIHEDATDSPSEFQPHLVDTPLNGRFVRLRTTASELMAMLDDGTVVIFDEYKTGRLSYNTDTLTLVWSKHHTANVGRRELVQSLDTQVFRWDSVYADRYDGSTALTVDGTAIQQLQLYSYEFFRGPIGGRGEWVSSSHDHCGHLLLKADGTLWHALSPVTPYKISWRPSDKRLIPPRWRPKQIGRLFPEPDVSWPK